MKKLSFLPSSRASENVFIVQTFGENEKGLKKGRETELLFFSYRGSAPVPNGERRRVGIGIGIRIGIGNGIGIGIGTGIGIGIGIRIGIGIGIAIGIGIGNAIGIGIGIALTRLSSKKNKKLLAVYDWISY